MSHTLCDKPATPATKANRPAEAKNHGKHSKINMLTPHRAHVLPIVAEELVAHTPATLSEMIGAVRQRGFRLNEIEMAAALGDLIDNGRAEILPPLRQMRRGARADARYAALEDRS